MLCVWYFYWKIIKILILINLIFSCFLFLKATYYKNEKYSYFWYKLILTENISIWDYKNNLNEVYNFIDFFFDIKFWFKNIITFISIANIFILIITILIAPLISFVITIYLNLNLIVYLIKFFKIKICKTSVIISFPEPIYGLTFKTFLFLLLNNLKLISFHRALKIFKIKSPSIKFIDLLNNFSNLLWYFSYILIFGRSLVFLKIYFLIINYVIIYTYNIIKNNVYPQKFIIRVRIYKNTLIFNFNWMGPQLFLTTYCNILTKLNFKFENGKLIENY